MSGRAGRAVGSGIPAHRRPDRYQQFERRALAHGAVHPDGAMVGFGDRRRGRQPEPEPADLPAPVGSGAGEPAEDPLQVGFRDTAAGVGHREDGVPVLDAGAELDAVALSVCAMAFSSSASSAAASRSRSTRTVASATSPSRHLRGA